MQLDAACIQAIKQFVTDLQVAFVIERCDAKRAQRKLRLNGPGQIGEGGAGVGAVVRGLGSTRDDVRPNAGHRGGVQPREHLSAG